MKNPTNGKPRTGIARVRRCKEDRWDFTDEDGGNFPIQMTKGGPTFGFCPAKVLRDDLEAATIYQTLIAILETGTWPEEGGLNNQEHFWVELVSEFGPFRRSLEFQDRYSQVAKGISDGLK